MLMPQADLAEAAARDDLHTSHALVARGCSRARAGQVTAALADLDDARQDWDAMSDLDRAVLLATSIECRLARGELTPALADGEAIGVLLDGPGRAAARAHFACGELSAAFGEPDAAAGHYARAGRVLGTEDPDLV